MKNSDIETELRARIAQLEADVIYIRSHAQIAERDAEKADAQNKRLRAQSDELVEALKFAHKFLTCAEIESLRLRGYAADVRKIEATIKKYDQ